MGIGKRAQFCETVAFTVRADMVNAFNHSQWDDPDMNINSATFGRILRSLSTRFAYGEHHLRYRTECKPNDPDQCPGRFLNGHSLCQLVGLYVLFK